MSVDQLNVPRMKTAERGSFHICFTAVQSVAHRTSS